MTQTRPIRVFPGMDLWKLGRQRLFSPDDAKLDICKSGLLESLSQPSQHISSCCRQVPPEGANARAEHGGTTCGFAPERIRQ